MKSQNVYSAPIDLTKVTKIQKDSIAHVGEMKHAIDFDAPEGTDVYAACNGVVSAIKDDSQIGGLDQKFENEGNYIEIKHVNNEISEYEHLLFQSAKVKVGDQVIRGSKIAEVGNTGWSECPHLHFMVYPEGQEYKTLEISFDEQLTDKLSDEKTPSQGA